jgi:Kef-type K+ transport system membrane component KefB
MSATFVTDFGTAAALSILFIKPNVWILPFVVASLLLISVLPRLAPCFFGRYGDRVIEPEIKLVFASLLLLMWLGNRAHSHAVLPAFVLGLALANHYTEHREEQVRLRVETAPIDMLARHSRRNRGTSTSAPARNVSTIPAKEPRNESQFGMSG